MIFSLKTTHGVLRFFNNRKNFGIIDSSIGPIYLPGKVLDGSKFSSVDTGDSITVGYGTREDGSFFVTGIDAITQPPRILGTIKWFNWTKGYGFVEVEGEKDVFLPKSILKKCGLQEIYDGVPVTLTHRPSERNPICTSIAMV